MIKKTKKAPAIRFRGFTEDWEQHKLSDIFSDFIVPMRDKPKAFGGDIPWTRIEDIEGKYINRTLSGQYITEETIKKMNLKIIPNGSLIVSSSATFGVIAIVTNDLITNQTFIGLVPKEKATLDYWYTYFHSYEARKYMMLQSAGSTIFYISRKSFENMPALTPSISEMIKIGEYFNNLDNLITLHQRKFDQLKKLKSYFLQNMFPTKDEKIPQIRFKGFSGDWEEYTLKDVADFNPKSLLPNVFEYVDLGSVIGTEIISHRQEMKKTAPARAQRLAKKGDVFYQTVRPYQKNNCLFNGDANKPYVFSTGYAQMRPYGDSYFLLTIVQNDDFVNNVLGKCTGTSYPAINSNDLSKIEVMYPTTLQEQIIIGKYFNSIDSLITLEQHKISQLQLVKKFMLQNMFV